MIDKDGKVELEELTYYGLQARLRSASKRAKIKQGRMIHGARHHAGTAIQRTTGNMKVTQRLLGHIDPKTLASTSRSDNARWVTRSSQAEDGSLLCGLTHRLVRTPASAGVFDG